MFLLHEHQMHDPIRGNAQLPQRVLGPLGYVSALENQIKVLLLQTRCLQTFQGSDDLLQLLDLQGIVDHDLLAETV